MTRRRWIAPQVIQTSGMDCGPAALKCLLDGHGIPASYARLRDACQTELDGTSIDALEETARGLGLDAEQITIPPDHLFLREAQALPAILVLRTPSGATHFVVVWSSWKGWVQVMDPAQGRRWQRAAELSQEAYVHTSRVPADSWREWASSEDFQGPLLARAASAGVSPWCVRRLWETAVATPGWLALGALDAAVRLLSALSQGGALRSRAERDALLERLASAGAEDPARADIPPSFWSVSPVTSPDGGAQLEVRGAVMLRIRGVLARRPDPAQLSPALAASIQDEAPSALRFVRAALGHEGALATAALCTALALGAGAVLVEALLFRGAVDIGPRLASLGARVGAIASVFAFLGALLLLEVVTTPALQRLGRSLEGRLRISLLERLPRLSDRYLESRLPSDLAERAHRTNVLGEWPRVLAALARVGFALSFTLAALIWMDPGGLLPKLLAAAIAVALPLLANVGLSEMDSRARTHAGALAHFYLDALRGCVPIRSAGAQRNLADRHEQLLTRWGKAALSLQTLGARAGNLQSALGLLAALYVMGEHLARVGPSGMSLLLAYWTLSLPLLGQELAAQLQGLSACRIVTLRLLEPLTAPMEPRREPERAPLTSRAPRPEHAPTGVSLVFRDVQVHAGGHPVLKDIRWTVEAGTHVAIVGASGAGKSTLVACLLGWRPPSAGRIEVDGALLDAQALQSLRSRTAWVDPSVQLWNRSLLDNLLYGGPLGPGELGRLHQAQTDAQLMELIARLPQGMQTGLGESGSLVSGGEGQRVRLGRGLLRSESRLVVLDEPFRGLDRPTRVELLVRARALWKQSTLLCVTHDVRETLSFPRVVVVDDGRIVEEGIPSDLAARPDSRYAALLAAERDVQERLWGDGSWRRQTLAEGQLT